MDAERPSPDELLAKVQAQERQSTRGRLKIFFGYVAGVGKTYAMLEAARRERLAGVDVVAGYVELHGRRETEALLDGLEILPMCAISHRGVTVREFDLAAALYRRPRLVLVDELAHTNAEGCTHAKRWQDVEDLLQAGIDVYTTLNVQHVESLNDVIAQITGVTVRETLPDAVLERADDIELIDLTPEELIERLKRGRVYVPQQVERALQNFFQKSNLVALRELSLRQVAQRLSRDVASARSEKADPGPWATHERLLVCVGPSPTTAKLIRKAKRMATALGAEWMAVAVETMRNKSSTGVRERIADHLRLAEQLGAETHILIGNDVASTLLDYARSRNVTKIVVGKTALPGWRRFLGTVVDDLLEKSGPIDVYVIRGEAEKRSRPAASLPAVAITWNPYIRSATVVALCGLVGAVCHRLHLADANIIMVFLLGVAFVASRYGRGPSILAAVLGVLAFDFFFVEPQLTFAVSDTQYFLTFAVMLAIGLVISTLTARLTHQLFASQQQERRTAALYRLTKQLSEVAGEDFLITSAGQQLREIFGAEVVIYLPGENRQPNARFGYDSEIARHPTSQAVAQWVIEHEQPAGLGTDTLPSAAALFVALVGSQSVMGALGVRPEGEPPLLDAEQRRLLESCGSLIALSLERDKSVLESTDARMQVQTEQLRNSLLSSVSHDLRTPLAAIGGAAGAILANNLAQSSSRELVQSINDEAQRLTRLVNNLLDMTRLQSGHIELRKDWHILEELVGSARLRLQSELVGHVVRVDLPQDLPLIHVDGVLIEQVFVNLIENAARYTPPDSAIEIRAHAEAERVIVNVSDDGPGFPAGLEARIFEKFFRAGSEGPPDRRRGVGLGLAICDSILKVHGGGIEAANRSPHGAAFILWLPRDENSPQVRLDISP